MKAALVASLVIHVAGLLAVPTGSGSAGTEPSATESQAIAAMPPCACDLEIAACPPAREAR